MVSFQIIPVRGTKTSIEKTRSALADAVTASLGFWILQNVFQVFGGHILKIHSGLPSLNTLSYGVVALVLSSYFAFSIPAITTSVSSILNENKRGLISDSRRIVLDDVLGPDRLPSLTTKVFICAVLLALIDRRAVSSAIPSSILSVGIFGNQIRGNYMTS